MNMNATAQMVTTTQVGCGKDRRKKPNSDQDIALEAEDLLKRLRNHIMAMAPHQKDRQQGKLLIEAESILAAITKTREQRLAKLGNDAINAALAAEREWYEGALVEANEYMNQQLAAERERRKAAETEWWAMVQRQRQQLAEAQAAMKQIISLVEMGQWEALKHAIDEAKKGDTTALDAAISKAVEKQQQSDDQFYYRQIDGLNSQHLQDIANAIAAAQQPLIDALDKYMKGLDAIYNHNEAARAAVVQHFGTIHPPEVVTRLLAKVKEGK